MSSDYNEDTKLIDGTLRDIAVAWTKSRDEVERLRAAFQEMVDKYTDPARGFEIKHVRCSYCAEAWPRLDGTTLDEVMKQTADHAEVCPKNAIRIERDRMRKIAREAVALLIEHHEQEPDRPVYRRAVQLENEL